MCVEVIILTNKLDARHRISVSSNALITRTLEDGKRRIILLSMFVNCRRGVYSVSTLFGRGCDFASKGSVNSSIRGAVAGVGRTGRGHLSGASHCVNEGMVRVYTRTSVAFLTLRNNRNRGNRLRTALSLFKVGCANSKCLNSTLTVGGNLAGDIFVRGGVGAPSNRLCGGRGSTLT